MLKRSEDLTFDLDEMTELGLGTEEGLGPSVFFCSASLSFSFDTVA